MFLIQYYRICWFMETATVMLRRRCCWRLPIKNWGIQCCICIRHYWHVVLIVISLKARITSLETICVCVWQIDSWNVAESCCRRALPPICIGVATAFRWWLSLSPLAIRSLWAEYIHHVQVVKWQSESSKLPRVTTQCPSSSAIYRYQNDTFVCWLQQLCVDKVMAIRALC